MKLVFLPRIDTDSTDLKREIDNIMRNESVKSVRISGREKINF